jgi:hypothetical protein
VTAIVLACQPRRNLLHLATDAAMYRHDQRVVGFGTKVMPISHWPGVVTCTGNAAAVPLFGWELAKQFANWDALIADADAGLSRLAEMVAEYGISHAAVLLAGISETRGPEAFTFQTTETLPPGVTREEAEASPYFQPPYVLVKLPDIIMTPPVPAETVIAANFEGIDADADPELVIWQMRKHLAMQRAMPLPAEIGGIGGWVELSTVSLDGISQRIVDRWLGDGIGGPLRPNPIDWTQWDRDNPAPTTRLRMVK